MIDFAKLENNVGEYRRKFETATPFEFVLVDNFLTADALAAIRTMQLDKVPASSELSSDLLFAKNKYESPNLASMGRPLKQLRKDLLSLRFQAVLREITSLPVFIDPKFARRRSSRRRGGVPRSAR